jgi:hypothetical protein
LLKVAGNLGPSGCSWDFWLSDSALPASSPAILSPDQERSVSGFPIDDVHAELIGCSADVNLDRADGLPSFGLDLILFAVPELAEHVPIDLALLVTLATTFYQALSGFRPYFFKDRHDTLTPSLELVQP